jgi:hypothetical protein
MYVGVYACLCILLSLLLYCFLKLLEKAVVTVMIT